MKATLTINLIQIVVEGTPEEVGKCVKELTWVNLFPNTGGLPPMNLITPIIDPNPGKVG